MVSRGRTGFGFCGCPTEIDAGVEPASTEAFFGRMNSLYSLARGFLDLCGSRRSSRRGWSALRRASLMRCRRDVVIYAEEVGRIVFLLDRSQAGPVCTEGRLDDFFGFNI